MNYRILGIIGGIALVVALLFPLIGRDHQKIKGLFEAADKVFVQGDYLNAIDKYKETITEATKRNFKPGKGDKDFVAFANYKIAVSYTKLAEKYNTVRYYASAISHIKEINPTTTNTQHQEQLPNLWEHLLFYEIGLENHESGNFKVAQNAFNILLKGFPNSEFTDHARSHFTNSLVKEAESLIKWSHYSKAINLLKEARTRAPESKVVHYTLGKAYFADNKLTLAKNAVREALKRDSAYHTARQLLKTIKDKHYNLGLSYQRSGKSNQAIREFKEAITLDKELNWSRKTFKEGYYHLGIAYFELGDFERAKQAATEALSIHRNYQDAKRLQRRATNHINYEQGLAYLKNRQYKRAISKFKEVVNSDSTFTVAHYNLATAYLGDNKLIDAENAAKKAYSQNYSPARHLLQQINQKYYDIGFDLLIKKKKYKDATVILKKVITLDKEVNAGRKKFKEAYYYLGRAYYELGDFERAKQAATEALSISHNYQVAKNLQRNATNYINYERGLAYLRNGQYKQAILAFKKVVISDSTFTEAHYYLGKAYLADNNPENAEHAAKKASNQNYLPARQLLQQIKQKYYDTGLNALERGRYTEAVPHIKKAVELGMKSKKAYTNLAIAYAGSGEFELAKRAAKAALRIDPDYPPALQVLNSID